MTNIIYSWLGTNIFDYYMRGRDGGGAILATVLLFTERNSQIWYIIYVGFFGTMRTWVVLYVIIVVSELY